MAEALSRKQMEDRIAALESENGQLKAAPPPPAQATEAPADPEMKAQLEAARAEIAALKSQPTPVHSTVKVIPYRGHVRATETCFAGLPGKIAPRMVDEVFEVDLDGLWTDDPFVAVEVTGTTESGAPITRPHPTARALDFTQRRQISVNTDLPPLRASSF